MDRGRVDDTLEGTVSGSRCPIDSSVGFYCREINVAPMMSDERTHIFVSPLPRSDTIPYGAAVHKGGGGLLKEGTGRVLAQGLDQGSD